MTILQETADVPRSADQAFAYVSDFTTTVEWDATARRAIKLTPGAVRVGTEFEVVCGLPVGSITILYTVRTLEPDKLIELDGTSRFFTISDSISFTRSTRGTRIDYRAAFEFKPLVKSLAALGASGLEKMGRDSVAGLAAALEDDFPVPEASGIDRPGQAVIPELYLFTRLGYKLGRKRFRPMSATVRGKHMVITGANAGIGYAAALELGRRGAELTLVMRDRHKAERAVTKLRWETGNPVISYELADLSLMTEVDNLVARLKQKGRAIDVLVNNAGALFNPRGETSEGLEQSYALLLLSPYRLTEGLKPLLLKSAAPRVINVVSGGMYSQRLEVDSLPASSPDGYSGSVAYARQKRALMILTQEWARDWAREGIVVNAMHPGWADTPGVRSALPGFRRLTRCLLRSAEQGADTIVWLAVASEAGMVSGKLFLDRQVRSPYIFRKTRENVEERRKLLDFLRRRPQLR